MAKMTPNGTECVSYSMESRFAQIALSEAKGVWQREIVRQICRDGYIQIYMGLKGKARSYSSKYESSAKNLFSRINKRLEELASPNIISYDQIGKKGGFGYYIE